jgi:hypothetical protein
VRGQAAPQWSLGQTPVALYVAPGAALLAGLVYGASFVGQGTGSEQMYLLRARLTETVEGEEESEPGRRGHRYRRSAGSDRRDRESSREEATARRPSTLVVTVALARCA